eukprot:COSAG03_NODE_2092_length_3140_cov_4.536994_2_plen_67_part_00
MNDRCGCVREPGCRLTGKNDWWTAESDWRPWVITLVESSVITQPTNPCDHTINIPLSQHSYCSRKF